MGLIHPIYRMNYEELKEIFDVVDEEVFKTSDLNGKVSLPDGKIRGLLKRAYAEKSGIVTRSGRIPYDYQFTLMAVEIFGEKK